MKELATALLTLINALIYEWKKYERKKAIERIKNDSDLAWADRFGRMQSTANTSEMREQSTSSSSPADQ